MNIHKEKDSSVMKLQLSSYGSPDICVTFEKNTHSEKNWPDT